MGTSTSDDDFEAFYLEHYSLVRTVVYWRLSGSSEVDDITSEVFRTALNHHREGGALTLPWVYGVIRNHVGTEYRRTHRARLFVAEMSTVTPASAPDLADRSDIRADVRSALQKLREGDREVILLAYWAEFSVDEMAAALKISSGAVRTRLSRATSALSRELARLGFVADTTGEVIANG